MSSTGRFFVVAVLVSTVLYVLAAVSGIDPKPIMIVFPVGGIVVASAVEMVLRRKGPGEPPAARGPGNPT